MRPIPSFRGPRAQFRWDEISSRDGPVKVKVWTLAIAPLTCVRLVTSSALQSPKWQLTGMSQCPGVVRCGSDAISSHTLLFTCLTIDKNSLNESATSIFQPPPSRRTTTSSQHARPSGVLRRRSDGLECAAWRPPRPVAQCRQFQQDAKDASVSECTWTLSALEALRNGLYKFKTYLLTYLLTYLRTDGRIRYRVTT